MTALNTWLSEEEVEDEEAILHPRRDVQQEDELDITPMIDVTFLLLIYFLVASVPDALTAVELPPAQYGVGVVSNRSVIITVADVGAQGEIAVYLDDGKVGDPLPNDEAAQAAAIRQAIEEGQLEGKDNVLIKAERSVRHRDISRISAVATGVENVTLNYAVLESD